MLRRSLCSFGLLEFDGVHLGCGDAFAAGAGCDRCDEAGGDRECECLVEALPERACDELGEEAPSADFVASNRSRNRTHAANLATGDKTVKLEVIPLSKLAKLGG